MPQRWPAITRNSPALKVSGAGPNSPINLTADEAKFLIGAKEVVAPTAPSNSVAPAVTGTATNGSTLTTTNGTWTGANLVYDYEWQRGAGGVYSKIPEAVSQTTYVLRAVDVGFTVRCVVAAQNAAGRVRAVSNATATVT